MPKKKVRKSSNSSGELFTNHPNVAWLLPLFVLLVLGFLVIHHAKEEVSGEDTSKKEVLKQMLQMNNKVNDGKVYSPTPKY